MINRKWKQKYYPMKAFSVWDTGYAVILYAAAGCHVELTTLIVPDKNDAISEMEEGAEWISSVEAVVRKKIPLHITRFS